MSWIFFFQAEDGIRDKLVTGVQTCALPICWRTRLLPPFLNRVRARLGVMALTDSLLERRLARILAARVAEVRWGIDARDEFLVHNDQTIRVAVRRSEERRVGKECRSRWSPY